MFSAMPRRRSPEDLSVEELRRLLVEKRRGARKERLDQFRRTGRVVAVTNDEMDPAYAAMPEVETPDHPDNPSDGTDSKSSSLSKKRKLADRLLLAIEIIAVISLVGILVNGLGLLRDLNHEVAQALNPVTPTPTPLVMAVVLPSGHTPPDAQGNTQPNEAEIPEHLRPILQSLANMPIPTAAPDQAVRIQIPAIQIDAPVVQGDGWEQLKKGVAQHIGSANPGQDGNVVLSAHNDVYGELFRHLDKLAPGDQVILFTQQRQFVYIIDRTALVEPTAVDVMASSGNPTVTLISCYPYLIDKQRIVVFARLQS